MKIKYVSLFLSIILVALTVNNTDYIAKSNPIRNTIISSFKVSSATVNCYELSEKPNETTNILIKEMSGVTSYQKSVKEIASDVSTIKSELSKTMATETSKASIETPTLLTETPVKVVPSTDVVSDLENITEKSIELFLGEYAFLSYTAEDLKFTKFSSSGSKIVSVDNNGKIRALAKGVAKITAVQGNEATIYTVTVKDNCIILDTKMRDAFTISNFKTVLQNPELPTGCEITALTQTLNYYGYNVSKTYMADNYLVKAAIGTTTFDKAFMSNPRNKSSYGCYSPVILKAANDYFNDNGNNHIAMNYSGADIETVYKIVNEGYPVIVWGTMNMSVPKYKYLWNSHGKPVYWQQGEHCLTLIGYDKAKNTVTLADPLKGVATYNKATFESRYNFLWKQAVVIKEAKREII